MKRRDGRKGAGFILKKNKSGTFSRGTGHRQRNKSGTFSWYLFVLMTQLLEASGTVMLPSCTSLRAWRIVKLGAVIRAFRFA
jgi:hypothetical protein